MNKNLFDSNWKQIRSQTIGWWSLINDLDLLKVDKSDVKLDKLVMMLRVKYNYTPDRARKEINKHILEFSKEQKTIVKPV